MNFTREFEVDFPYEKTYQDWENFIREKKKRYQQLIKETALPFFRGSLFLVFVSLMSINLWAGVPYSGPDLLNISFTEFLNTDLVLALCFISFGISSFFTLIFSIGLAVAKISTSSNKNFKKEIFQEIRFKRNRSRYLCHPDKIIRSLTRQTFYV